MITALAFAPSAVFSAAFLCSVRQDRRMFRNAVLLGLVAISTAVALLFVRPRHAEFLLALYFLGTVLGGLLLSFFMVVNGFVMIRKEGRRPANLLSLLLGLTIVAVLFLLENLRQSGSPAAATSMGVLLLLSAYVAFLFVCFLGYAFLYGRVRVRGDVDFVVMLGSGLLGGERVPPLLASRLRKGLEIHDRQIRRGGKAPVLLTSGGQGADERVAESTAMARWLVDNGAPPANVREEDRSRTTDENLRYSRTIMAADNPGYRCVVVTNNFHAFRAALTARRAGVNGQVLGSPTARYYWPSATIREFVAIMSQHRVLNLAMGVLLTGLAVLLSGPAWH
ncbi:YdcF family protein [Streptomyces sp. SM14]|uniref:YdcF family protein n=1 Tax=Streptomyces sp. SM14 TaxID=1736045 RepID=UPI002156367F|nr:YdcF family protein [Streptomyces sp. SM14]